METLKGGTTSTVNGTNEIDRNGQNLSIKFQKMKQSTWNGPIISLEIGEVLDLIEEDLIISLNRPIRFINRRRSSQAVFELIERNITIKSDEPIGLLEGTGQLAWSGQ